jgi:predicted aspartyl protease
MRNATLWVILAAALHFAAESANADEINEPVPFKLYKNHYILVHGSVMGSETMKMVIDTGANCSVLNGKTAKRLGLRPKGEKFEINAFGRVSRAQRAVLRGLRIGPVLTSVVIFVADLSWLGVDAIIGLDVLRRQNLTIDYEGRTLAFGHKTQLRDSVTFENDGALVMIRANVHGHPVRLAIDTGSKTLCLYHGRRAGWTNKFRVRQQMGGHFLGGNRRLREVVIPSVELGSCRWNGLGGLIEDVPNQPMDGVLGLVSLKLKQVHFDFENHIMSWNR